jgi:hypothetical protein
MGYMRSILYSTSPLRLVLLLFSLWWLVNLIMRHLDIGKSPAMDHILTKNSFQFDVPIWTFIAALQAMGLHRDHAQRFGFSHILAALAWTWTAIMLMDSPFAIIYQLNWLMCGLSLWATWRAYKMPSRRKYDHVVWE